MTKPYREQVELLLAVIPFIAKESCFALKGRVGPSCPVVQFAIKNVQVSKDQETRSATEELRLFVAINKSNLIFFSNETF